MLDEIIKNNEELQKSPFIIPILKEIENYISESDRTNFYRNLQTLKIELTEDGELCYRFKENIMIINTNYDEYLLGNWKEENRKEASETIIKGNLYHELLHMASTNYDKELNLINSGFEAIIPGSETNPEEKILNNYLNEGFTEMFSVALYPDAYSFSGYKDSLCVANIITSLVGVDNIKHLYFSNGLAIRLKNNIASFTDEENINKLFSTLENGYMAKLMSEYSKNASYMTGYYNNLSFALTALLDIVKDGLQSGVQNGVFNTREEMYAFYNQYIKPNLQYLINAIKSNEFGTISYEEYLSNINLDDLTETLSFGTSLTKINNNLGCITTLSLCSVFGTILLGIIMALIFIKIL